MFTRPHTPESRERIRLAITGMKRSPETKAKMRAAHVGVKLHRARCVECGKMWGINWINRHKTIGKCISSPQS